MTRRQALSAAAVPLLGLPACARRSASALDSLTANLGERIPKLLERHRVPGLSIALVKDAALVWSRGFGVKQGGTSLPVRTDTVFEAAALSQPVFTYAVLQLVERGRLALDTPLVSYGAPPVVEGDPRARQITARHVLTHSSGLPDWRGDGEPMRLDFDPGTRFQYSCEGFAYLQSVVLLVTSQPFDAFMRDSLFTPLGLRTAGYLWNGMRRALAASPHDASGKMLEPTERTPESVARHGAADGLMCAAPEYARFLIELLAPQPRDGFRLSAESLREMFRAPVPAGDARGSSRGLGWQLFPNGAKTVFSHGGGNRGFHAFAVASLEDKAAWVVMTNGDGGPAVLEELASGGLNAFLGWRPQP